MRKKCFTLVELLVVIGIIAVLMGILLPALSAVKRTAQRVVCGSNQAGIGKALLLYANEYAGDFPCAGDPTQDSTNYWGPDGFIADWSRQDGRQYGQAQMTITASLYLLVHFEDVTTAQFNCKGDAGVRELKLSDAKGTAPAGVSNVTDVWDFGGQGSYSTISSQYYPGNYNSYAYHDPYRNTDTKQSYALRSDSNPSCPVLADRNPYWDKNADSYIDSTSQPSCDTTTNTYKDENKIGNSACHQRDGQNVLYVDTHVRFEKFPNVGIAKDNMWKPWEGTTLPATPCDYQLGIQSLKGQQKDGATPGAGYSLDDAFLVSETNRAH